jgi:hypothetical protein
MGYLRIQFGVSALGEDRKLRVDGPGVELTILLPHGIYNRMPIFEPVVEVWLLTVRLGPFIADLLVV